MTITPSRHCCCNTVDSLHSRNECVAPTGREHGQRGVDCRASTSVNASRDERDEVAVDGDGEDGERRDVDADAEHHRHGVAERLAERPRAQQAGQRREGHGQQAEQHVGGRQVAYEHVATRHADAPTRRHHVDDGEVAGKTEQEDGGVEQREQRHEPRRRHHHADITSQQHSAAGPPRRHQ